MIEAEKPSTKSQTQHEVQGDSSKNNKDELDESILLGWLKENVGDKEESLKVLNAVQLKLDKTRSLIDELRAMGHDITDDHYVDLNFFSAD
ncbi:hypothetical protein CTI12_AA468340 [Artemisia annua]|uniref:Uncharacterized protein n=1 Tax=Artemisia annua TaxID=35608 RepID=A0A2U1LPT3_ARTAN|nr:hypothetical protein CTI12_AA468340 [Artemisia annua]